MIKIVVIAIAGILFIQLLKQYKLEYSMLIKLTALFILIILILPEVTSVLGDAEGLIDKANVGTGYISIIIKSLGITIVTQIASDLCRDSNENSLASVVELSGKLAILALALPILKALLALTIGIIEG